MRKKKSIVLIGATVLAAVFFAAQLSIGRDADVTLKPAAEPNLFPFLKPLAGAEPERNFRITGHHALTVDVELRRLFDRYPAVGGEISPDAMPAEITHELNRQLGPDAIHQANNLLQRYRNYRSALAELERNATAGEGVDEAVHARLAAIQLERARFFSGHEINGLFSSDDPDDVAAIVRRELGRNQSLRDVQKQEKLLALSAPMEIATIEKSVQQMRSGGVAEDVIYRARAAALSLEAADRLTQLDRAEAAWKSRTSAYLAERTRLIESSGSAFGAEQSHVLQQLRDARFTSDEQQRLSAYEPSNIPQLR